MLRLPGDLLDPEVVADYCVDEQLSARATARFVVLSLTSEDDAGDFDHDVERLLSTIVGVRAELAAGDLPVAVHRLGWPRRSRSTPRACARALARERRLDELAGEETPRGHASTP